MKTYSVYNQQSGRVIADKISINDVYNFLPAGCSLSSGNVRDSESGQIIVRALYRRGSDYYEVRLTQPEN